MDDRVYWIWLQHVIKYGSNKIRTINLIYDNAEAFYNSGEMEWKLCGCFTPREIDIMKEYKISEAEAILDKCMRLGFDVITIKDHRYPERLKSIFNPPCVLYVKGKLPDVDNKICISIVGTRSSTVYGNQMAFDISFELGKADAIVVSGGALGVDGFSHKGALQGGGKTILVLGCGLNYPYLMQHASLRDAVSKNGAVISEFAPDFPAYNSNFPMRNRIISGLSLGTVIIEAGENSGSLITASLALEQNRDVFAVPVDMRTSVSKGTTSLIRDGAKVVVCAEDILSEYRSDYFRSKYFNRVGFESSDVSDVFDYNISQDSSEIKTVKNKSVKKQTNSINQVIEQSQCDKNEKNFISGDESQDDKTRKNENKMNLSSDEQTVYNILKNGKKHIDLIIQETGLPVRKLQLIITNLEISGIIESYAGKIYGIKK